MAHNGDISFGTFSLAPLGDDVASGPQQLAHVKRPSRVPSRSPPPPRPPLQEGDSEEEGDKQEDDSALDTRRFSSNLHANLVSEILKLRNEVEIKGRLVLDLEESLATTQDDNARLNQAIATNNREAREAKRHMNLLEGGTLSALDELAKERDQAKMASQEVRKRLEASQKKTKSQEEDLARTNALWQKDQENWESERRQLDHKYHIVDSRLKTVLAEVEAAQLNGRPKSSSGSVDRPHSRTSDRALSRASGALSSLSHHRRNSSVSTDGGTKRFRLSHISEIVTGDRGTTLADELHFDDDFDDDDLHDDDPISPEALPEEHTRRPFSAQSHRQSVKARKLLGLAIGDAEQEEETSRDINHNVVADVQDNPQDTRRSTACLYVDTATQFSPPPSPPLLQQTALDTIAEADDERSVRYSLVDAAKEDAANKGLSQPVVWKSPETTTMVSSSCQTVEQPPSPPSTPVEGGKGAEFATSSLPKPVETCTSSTQTTAEILPSLSELAAASRGAPVGKGIPTIAIHPPSSSHGDRQSVVLPPQTKSVACQAHIVGSVKTTGTQTEGIRIDRRPVKLPPHLLPSAITSRPTSPTPEAPQLKITKPHTMKVEEDVEDKANLRSSNLSNRSAKRVSAKSLQSSTKSHSDIEKDPSLLDVGDDEISEDSFVTKVPMKKTLSKVQNSWKLVPQAIIDKDVEENTGEGGTATILGDWVRTNPKTQDAVKGLKERKPGKFDGHINTSRVEDVRKTAMISSGTAAHATRARSPSAPAAPGNLPPPVPPPFDIPTRSSSRKVPWGSSDGTASPTPQTVSFFGIGQQDKQRRPPAKKPVLRKIKSATNELYAQRERSRSRSPPPTSASSFPESSPQLPVHPPLPDEDVNFSYRSSFRSSHKGQQPSTVSAAESAASSEQVSVVDAIAHTMIGEWMWKYVRRRTTFGLPDGEYEGRSGESANGVRHKRWVWLAPYERAVMWSSKQPTTGTALLGKSGRKFIITNVLDVRDDAPMPKGADFASSFGRSILIITPQRALKFTAMTRERHYLWLNALSFLCHSSVIPDFDGPAPTPTTGQRRPALPERPPSSGFGLDRSDKNTFVNSQPPPPPSTTSSLRRHPIRDSIRVAKGKPRPQMGGRRAYTDPRTSNLPPSLHGPSQAHFEQAMGTTEEQASEEAAEPPQVPRLHSHARKRSLTGPAPNKGSTAPSFRSFSSSARPSMHSLHSSSRGAQTNTRSLQSRAGSDVSYGCPPDSAAPSTHSSVGRRSNVSDWAHDREPMPAQASGKTNFDNDSTVRMEAFVKDAISKGYTARMTSIDGSPAVDGHEKGPTIFSLDPHRSSMTNGISGGRHGAPVNRMNGMDRVPERKSYRTKEGRKKDLKYWGVPRTGSSDVKDSTNPFEGF
jgi:hypothetical protein